MKIVVTGGAGFIGSNFIRYILSVYPDYRVINIDALTYAGNLLSLEDVSQNPNYTFVHGDIANFELVREITAGAGAVINFAAETHVDRSIEDPFIFVRTNVLGMQMLLEAVKNNGVDLFIQISTDEVYGSLGDSGVELTEMFNEESMLKPNSPYAASKAAADHIVRAYSVTYKLPTIITRCTNNYGPYQYPEKLIPLFIMNALMDKTLPLYGDGMNIREWIHVEDHCRAIDAILHHGRIGEIYNIGSGEEMRNINIAELILDTLGKPKSLINYVTDRPGHDRRYALDSTKIKEEVGWKPIHTFKEGIRQTIKWYIENKEWYERILAK
ncbi:MAG: dTDP-glucose 4,6-dehydratase [Nitrospirota bacterium]